jgi:hypothetical protein
VKFVLVAFALIGAFFLIAEHRAHVMPLLPWLFLAACPLMHVFMHHGHGGHRQHRTLHSSGRANRSARLGDTTPSTCGYTNPTGPSERSEGEQS